MAGKDRKIVQIWSDASYIEVHRIAAWGAVIIHGDEEMEVSGIERYIQDTDTAEIVAVYKALWIAIELFEPVSITLFSDSEAVWRGFMSEPHFVKDNRWSSLWWDDIRPLVLGRQVVVYKIKGHTGVAYNERADQLAKLQKQKWREQ